MGELNEKMHVECLAWARCPVNGSPHYSHWISAGEIWKIIFIYNTKGNKGTDWVHQCQGWVSERAQVLDELSSILACFFSVCKIFASHIPRLALYLQSTLGSNINSSERPFLTTRYTVASLDTPLLSFIFFTAFNPLSDIILLISVSWTSCLPH